MIKKLTLQNDERILCGKDYMLALRYAQNTINQLVDAVNELQKNATISKMENVETPAENVQPDAESRPKIVQQISYMAPGDITVFHGFNCSVEFDTPLPEGTRITIKSIIKGGDNE